MQSWNWKAAAADHNLIYAEVENVHTDNRKPPIWVENNENEYFVSTS